VRWPRRPTAAAAAERLKRYLPRWVKAIKATSNLNTSRSTPVGGSLPFSPPVKPPGRERGRGPEKRGGGNEGEGKDA
jgi:hypothetical protein